MRRAWVKKKEHSAINNSSQMYFVMLQAENSTLINSLSYFLYNFFTAFDAKLVINTNFRFRMHDCYAFNINEQQTQHFPNFKVTIGTFENYFYQHVQLC